MSNGRLAPDTAARGGRADDRAHDHSSRGPSPLGAVSLNPDARRGPRKLILCFDGTGNKFHGNESDSNILKIFRMLDRTADDQYHYYQRRHTGFSNNFKWNRLTLPSRDRDVCHFDFSFIRKHLYAHLVMVQEGQRLGNWVFLRSARRGRLPLPHAILQPRR